MMLLYISCFISASLYCCSHIPAITWLQWQKTYIVLDYHVHAYLTCIAMKIQEILKKKFYFSQKSKVKVYI